eukprot:Hpha_TRINITY_DN15576_c0_g2::TRINITY_DN15576_c0_g2_i1::g.108700::m.108700
MSGLIVFVSAPGRSDSVVDLDISATVGDLLRQFNEQSGLAARGILWEDRTVNDEKLALADLGICPESRVRVQLRGHCGWVQEGLQHEPKRNANAILMDAESGAFVELNESSNGWFRWNETFMERREKKRGRKPPKRATRMAWPDTEGAPHYQGPARLPEYEVLLDKKLEHELPGEHGLEDRFGEESTFVWGMWQFYRFDWGVYVRNFEDSDMRMMLLPERLVVFVCSTKAWHTVRESETGFEAITEEEWEELNQMLGEKKVTYKYTREVKGDES